MLSTSVTAIASTGEPSTSVMLPLKTSAATVIPVLSPSAMSSAIPVTTTTGAVSSTGGSLTATTVIVTVAAELLVRFPSLAVYEKVAGPL